ncbi:MAG: PASTA domain-containing protein, partial [Bacteroidetes bacterium]
EKLEVKDAVAHNYDTVTVERAFQISSNVGMAKMALACYGRPGQAARFVKRLRQFNLHLPTGIEIEGEANPYIKDPGNPEDDWSGATLPWMSMGYELLLTPLQLLSFYNAVANDGKMMKPYLVEEIQRYGQTIEHFPPVVLKRKIASTETIRKAQRLLRGVVEHGTASEWNTPHYAFAGKTGTTQLDYRRLDDRTEVGGYQASFVGYFPADAPRYSCIVLISNPRKGGIYGSQVALPVFREIADKIYFSSLDLHEPLNSKPRPRLEARKLPDYEIGARKEMKSVLEQLRMPYKELTRSDWVVVRTSNTDTLQLLKRRVPEEKVVPNVVGMTLRDALYILENRGLEVEVAGFGKVVRQSLKPGTKVTGQTIKLTLK